MSAGCKSWDTLFSAAYYDEETIRIISRFSSSGRRRFALTALLAEFGPEVAILAPDFALAFPNSEAVNAALRALIAASKTVREVNGTKKRHTAA
jgi:hypothetical protein